MSKKLFFIILIGILTIICLFPSGKKETDKRKPVKKPEIEKIGLSIGAGILPPAIPPAEEQVAGASADFMYDLQLGYTWNSLFHLSYDLMLLSPYAVKTFTSRPSDDGTYLIDGFYRPGVLNLIDLGIRPVFSNVALNLQGGFNYLYIYDQKTLYSADDTTEAEANFGINLKYGVGLQYEHWGIMLNGVTVFSSIPQMTRTMKYLFDPDPFKREEALNQFSDNAYPTLSVHLSL